MVGVGQDQRRADFTEDARAGCFDRRLGADGRKDRRLQRAVRRGESSGAGVPVRRFQGELEHDR